MSAVSFGVLSAAPAKAVTAQTPRIGTMNQNAIGTQPSGCNCLQRGHLCSLKAAFQANGSWRELRAEVHESPMNLFPGGRRSTAALTWFLKKWVAVERNPPGFMAVD